MGLYIGSQHNLWICHDLAYLLVGFHYLFGIVVCLIIRLSGHDEHDLITAAQVKEIEDAHLRRSQTV